MKDLSLILLLLLTNLVAWLSLRFCGLLSLECYSSLSAQNHIRTQSRSSFPTSHFSSILLFSWAIRQTKRGLSCRNSMANSGSLIGIVGSNRAVCCIAVFVNIECREIVFFSSFLGLSYSEINWQSKSTPTRLSMAKAPRPRSIVVE